MKQSKQALFCISFIFFSCGQPQKKETPEKQDSLSREVVKSEATINKKYWPLDMDTLVSEKEILIDNESFNLKIIKYCHNDSAVVNEVGVSNGSGNGAPIELHISHNYSDQIILTKDNKIIFDNLFSKDALKEQLTEWSFRRLMLYDIQYDFASTNKLYFKATLVPPDTNWIEEVKFTVFYQTEKAGQIDFWDVEPDRITYNDLKIYDLRYYDKNPNEKVGFTSLSDNYPLSDHPDSLAIPDLYSVEDDESGENDEYFRLKSKYRKRFLDKTKISETDSVFVYNYYHNLLASFKVKSLPVAARLNDYSSKDYRPHSQGDYMIGFELDNVLKEFGDYYYKSLVYVGKENPFVQGQLKPVVWKEIEPKDFPFKATSTKNSLLLRGYDKGRAYKYETTDFGYFVQEFLIDNRISARRLLIIDLNTKETVRDEFYFDSEGSSPAPLNDTTNSYRDNNQWTGELFKNKPPVIFGFEYISFGCPYITFLNKSVEDVYIYCDNRH